LEADIHRVDCRACGRVRTEQVPWARPNARHTSDFENVVAWLAQLMDKTGIGRLLRCSWEAVDAIVARVVVDRIDDSRLDDLYRIGVEEISYKRGRKFLTIVADHDTGNVVWVGKQRSNTAFEEFFTALGPQRAAAIEAISLDGSSVYLPVTREQIPQARICLDPFHVVNWTNEVVESVYRAEAPRIPSDPGMPERRDWRRTRFAVRAGREHLDEQHRQILQLLRRHRYRLWRTWELKEQLRDLYRSTDPVEARADLKPWCTAAKRSRIASKSEPPGLVPQPAGRAARAGTGTRRRVGVKWGSAAVPCATAALEIDQNSRRGRGTAEGGPGGVARISLATAGYEPAPRATDSLSTPARIGDGLNPLTMR
jgi:transposase